MEFWKIEMLMGTNYYEAVYMKQETFDLFEKYLEEIETKVNELKLLPENKDCFGENGWWEIDFKYLKEEDQLNYNFDQPLRRAYILYEAIDEVLKKYGYNYDKEATEINKYIEGLDCFTTVKYNVKKAQVENLNKIVEGMNGVVINNGVI